MVNSSRADGLGGSYPLWYLTIYFGDRCPIQPSLVGAEGFDKASEPVSEVSSPVGFFDWRSGVRGGLHVRRVVWGFTGAVLLVVRVLWGI